MDDATFRREEQGHKKKLFINSKVKQLNFGTKRQNFALLLRVQFTKNY